MPGKSKKKRASAPKRRPKGRGRLAAKAKTQSRARAARPAKSRAKPKTAAPALDPRARKPVKPIVHKPVPTPLEKRLQQLERSSKKPASGQSMRQRMYQRAKVPRNYVPADGETFMGPRQAAYFKNRLLDWRDELLRESSQTIMNLQESSLAEPDLADRASAESDRSIELRTRDRERKLISKIDAALERIENGTYGFCEETGEPIGLKRLIARPIATLSIEAQERHERREKVYRDD
jgi:DnaK suppressor protein